MSTSRLCHAGSAAANVGDYYGELTVPTSEHQLSFEWNGLRLAGSLHLPAESGPHPAVLMAQGSGPADRNAGGYFEPIRQAFHDRDMATFAFDKPGCGESSGHWHSCSLDDRASQLIAALTLVRAHADIADAHVGVFGHSQGGWLVQKLARRRDGFAFAIANSAPTINIQEQILYDNEQRVRARGYDQQATLAVIRLTHALFEEAAADANFESISERLLTPASHEQWFALFPEMDGASDWEHLKLLIGEPHDPVSDLQRVACPFLAVYGGLDALLPPWQGAEEAGLALATAESTDVTVVISPTGDHRLQDPDTAEFVDGYLDLLGDWAARRAH